MIGGLDPLEGAQICQIEQFGDWYRDPCSWPELEWVISNPAEFPMSDVITQRGPEFSMKEKVRFEPIMVPKSSLGARPAVLMTLDAKIAYHAAGVRLLKKMHRELPDWVYGWRFRDGAPKPGVAKNGDEWDQYSVFYARQPKHITHALQTDITSFFGSIEVGRMAEMLLDATGRNAPAQVLVDVIQQHDNLQTRSGLPQRSWTSAFLANLYVRAIDDTLDDRLRRGSIDGVARWMDDIQIVGKEESLYRLFADLQDRFREIGLEPNSSKSKLLPISDMRQGFHLDILDRLEIPTKKSLIGMGSGGWVRVDSTDEDLTTLFELEEAVLDQIHICPPNIVKRLLIELRNRLLFERFDSWLEQACRLPHLAATLSRYFREGIHGDEADSATRREAYVNWFTNFISSDWSALPWVSAQYATAISSAHCDDSGLKDILRGWLSTSEDLQQVSLAGQRLSAVDPKCVRDLVRRRADSEARPLFQRSLALIALTASDNKRLVETIISQDAHNVITARFLDASRYAIPAISADFDIAHRIKRQRA